MTSFGKEGRFSRLLTTHRGMFPVEIVPEGQAYLRLKKAKNNQEKGIIWAKDYEM